MAKSAKNDKIKISIVDKNSSILLPLVLLIMDYVAILLAEYMALAVRKYVIPIPFAMFDIPKLYFYILVPLIFLLFMQMANVYSRKLPFWELASDVFRVSLYSLFTLIMLLYFGGVSGIVSRLFVLLYWFFSFSFVLSLRYFTRKALNKMGLLQVPVIFIGAGKTAELILKSFENDSGFGYRVVGIIDDHPVSEALPKRFMLLGGFESAAAIIRDSGIQTVIIAAPGLPNGKLVALLNSVQPYVKNVAFVPDLLGAPVGNLELERLFDEKLMLLKVRNNLARWYNRLFKRLFDLTVSSICLIVFIPLWLLLSIIICLDSPGPVMFAHRRVGRHGRQFPCYKFRTMIPEAEQVLEAYLRDNPAAREEWENGFKLKNDPRITRIGKFLRRTSLDELPQFINVLKGEMSLVGPRPIVTAEIERYGDSISDYYIVPPGITGMWQVNGRSDTTYQERVEMDSWYVRNWSVWIDIVYLLKTVRAVAARKGAY